MLFTEMLLVALQSVRANLFRAFLTTLGIVIGVASVIAMVAIGSGARAAVDEQIEALGASILTIRSGSMFRMGVAQGAETLEIDDAEALVRDATTLSGIVPEIAGQLQVKLGTANENLRVVGTTPNFVTVQSYALTHGRSYTAADDAAKRPLAVLGAMVATKLDSSNDSIVGQTIYIRGLAFEVIGVLEEKGQQGFRNVDEQVWVPLSTASVRLFGKQTLDSIAARIAPGVAVENAIVDIERVLRREHQILPGKDNDFSIADPRQFFNVRETAARIFAGLLAGIASISLIVGGIGIMNIMLVTVTERTREIGIRKALGATQMNIMMQFVVEAVVLCLIGGVLGILLGAGIASLLSGFGIQVEVSMTAIAAAFAFSVATGLFFGIWPARKAARLDPIEALRYE